MSENNSPKTVANEQGPIEKAVAGSKGGGLVFFIVGGLFVLLAAVVSMFVLTSGDISETVAPATLSAEATVGKQLYISNGCGGCHPAEGRAGGVGPRLSTTGLGDQTIKNIIRRGKGGMPGNSQISEADMDKIVVYIRELKPKGK